MVRKKIIATTDNSKWEAPKKRKPMTEEQKKAASERLAKARATKLAKNPDYGNAGVHSSVRELIPEHTLHPEKVKNWIKTQKDLAKVQRISVDRTLKVQLQNLLPTKDMFAICKVIFVLVIGLMIFMGNTNKVE